MKRMRFAGLIFGVLSLCILTIGCGGPDVTPNVGPEAPSDGPPPTEIPVILEFEPPEPGETQPWVDASLLVYIPPGEFVMGGEEEDNPDHVVYLDSFWIYRTEVTNRMYLNCMIQGECPPPAVDPAIHDIENPELADHPVIGVNWYMAAGYCRSVGGLLPSEAQWERAARGTNGDTYPWGNDEPTCDLLNFNNCLGETSEVRDFLLGASPEVVLDMAGNVFEWVADWYHEAYYPNAPFDNPMGPESGEDRSLRGSTYMSSLDQVPSALRYFLNPDEYRADLGFRCVIPEAEYFAPPCEVLAYAPPDDAGVNPDDPPGGQASCIVQEPVISVVTYCNKGERGNNISWTPADADINYASTEGASCSQYDQDTLACSGKYGSTVDLTACKSCPPPVVELGVLASCDPPYVLDDAAGYCRFVGPPVPGVEICAPGFEFTHEKACCDTVDGRTPLDFPVCPVGGRFDQPSKICWFTLPSTGDSKCATENVYFRKCEKAEEDDPGDGGNSCANYGNENACVANDCNWWCFTTGQGIVCNCIP